jgi:N-acetyl sugar amidotransferase
MDTSDPAITFDATGLCCHCQRVEQRRPLLAASRPDVTARFEAVMARIKGLGRGRDYDGIVGLSGGTDSAYAAVMAHRHGLRLLAVHCDSGWNSEQAVHNIERLVKALGIDLLTFVFDWEEIRDLQLAFFRASVPNCDIPQDHVFIAGLWRTAARYGIRTIISGGNFATECILPDAWGHGAEDLRHLKAIHRRFGSLKLRNLPTTSVFKRYFWYPYVRGIRELRILDWIGYDKARASEELTKELGFEEYGGKHHESLFTRFFQGYYLPQKFGFDKRRAHLSSLIVNGHMSREDALSQMQLAPYGEAELQQDLRFFLKKLRLSEEEWRAVMQLPPKDHFDYPNTTRLFRIMAKLKNRYRLSNRL